MNGTHGMKRTTLTLAFSLAAVVLWASVTCAQGPTADDPEVVILKDGLSWRPENVTWFHTYIDLWWLVGMMAVAVLMLWTAKWIDDDARRHGIDAVKWNYVTMTLCLAALVAFFVVPVWISLPVSLAALVGVVAQYVPVRNRRVMPSRRLFTPEHRMLLRKRFLRLFGVKSRDVERKLARVAKKYLPVTLFFQTGQVGSPAEAPPDEEDPATAVKDVMGRAVRRHAREVYLAPKAGKLAVSFKIDGVVYSEMQIDRLRGGTFMTLVKRLADVNSPEPHFRIQLPTMNARFTVFVWVEGEGDAESMTMRLSPDEERLRRLDQLGLTADQSTALKKAFEGGHGLIAVASPPGMGGHTTIGAMLDSLDPYSRNIATFERPVTVRLASIEQNDLTDATEPLADILKEKLRQDYDLMMLDEVPDKETAMVALSAVERQQVVIARFDLGDTVGIVRRLCDLGVAPDVVAAGIHTLVAERLVRVLCPTCRTKVAPSAELLRKLHLETSQAAFFYEESAGCDVCGKTGFHGRTGVFEVWQPGEESRKLIAGAADDATLRAALHRDGVHSLQHAGLAKVIEGTTSLKELAHVLKIGT